MRSSSELLRFKGIRVIAFPLSGMLCLSMFRISIGVLIPEVARDFPIKGVEVGLVLSAYLGAMALVMAFGGYTSDRIGDREAMCSGMALMALGILLGGVSKSFNALLASIFVAGIGAGVFTPSLYAYIGGVQPRRRGLLAGITNSAYAFGGFLGPPIFALLASGYGWRLPLMVFGVLSLVCAAAIFTVPCIRRRDVVKAGASFRSVLRVRGVIPIASALAIANIGFVSSTAWVPKFLVDAGGFTIVNAGLAFGLYSLSGGIGSIVLGWLSDRLDRSKVISSTSMAAAFLAMIYYVEVIRGLPTAALMAFSAILGFLSFAYWNLSIAAAQDLADSSLFGSVTGLVQDTALISAAAAPIISGGLISLMDMSSALIVSVSIPYLAHGLIFASYGLKTRLRR